MSWFKSSAYYRGQPEQRPAWWLAEVIAPFNSKEAESAHFTRAWTSSRVDEHQIAAGTKVVIQRTPRKDGWILQTIEKKSDNPIAYYFRGDDFLKGHIKATRDESGKPVSGKDPWEIYDQHVKPKWDPADATNQKALEMFKQRVQQLAANLSTQVGMTPEQTLAAALANMVSKKFGNNLDEYFVDVFNAGIDNPWSTNGMGVMGLVNTATQYFNTQCLAPVKQKLDYAKGQTAEQVRSKQNEEYARKNGLVVCPRCGGRGEIQSYRHIDAGVCYECDGHRFLDPHNMTNNQRMNAGIPSNDPAAIEQWIQKRKSGGR